MKKLLLLLALVGCATGMTTHQKLLVGSMATLSAAETGFANWDNAHQVDIVASATSHDDVTTKLAAYRASRQKVTDDIIAAKNAIDQGWKLDTDPSVANAVALIVSVTTALAQLGVTK